MKRTWRVWALAALLALNIVLVILLTPLGFESRPPSDLKIVGYIAIGTVFAGLILDLVSLVLLFWRVRLASGLAILGSLVLVVPVVVDRTGSFFTLPIPPVINNLEYVFMVVLLATLVLAVAVYRESKPLAR